MKNFTDLFLKKYPKQAKVLEYYEKANGIMPDYDNINRQTVSAFVDILCESVSPNAARLYCAWFKTILQLNPDSAPSGLEKALSLREKRSIHTFLSEKEIKNLIAMPIDTVNKQIIRDQFVLGCITGARHSDYIQFTRENINGGWLGYVSQKTHIFTEIPTPAYVKKLIRAKSPALETRNLSGNYFNRIIKELCRDAGIDEIVKTYERGETVTAPKWALVTSHTARRSCASNLAIRGVDEMWIKRILGHGTTITGRYVCCTNRDMPQAAINYFNEF